MKEWRSTELQATWLKAIAPGTVMSALLLVASIFDWSFVFSLRGFVLLVTAWVGGVAWALMSEPAHPVDGGTGHQVADYLAEFQSMAVAIQSQRVEEMSTARIEVRRARAIVQQAAEGLNLSFLRLSAHAKKLNRDMPAVMQRPAAGAVCQARPLSAESDSVDGDIAQAVRCLQFEDIVTQSLLTADNHLQRLNELDTLMQRALPLASNLNPVQLKRLKAEFEVHASPRKHAGGSVPQESMDSGDIEIF